MYYLNVRNRATDHHSQLAKTCMNIFHGAINYYKDKSYQEHGYGYQRVEIDNNLFLALMRYIKEERATIVDKKKGYYNNSAVADTVTDEWKRLKRTNYYLFLNTKGGPLLGDTWNVILRRLYDDVGLTRDKEVRSDNLNHRFRHGFAMNQARKPGMTELKLARLLRHKNVLNVMIYFNPTIEEQIKSKETVAEILVENAGVIL